MCAARNTFSLAAPQPLQRLARLLGLGHAHLGVALYRFLQQRAALLTLTAVLDQQPTECKTGLRDVRASLRLARDRQTLAELLLAFGDRCLLRCQLAKTE
jgi:hypothetical protein